MTYFVIIMVNLLVFLGSLWLYFEGWQIGVYGMVVAALGIGYAGGMWCAERIWLSTLD